MLHQRIGNAAWLSDVATLSELKNSTNVVRQISRNWTNIMQHDYLAIFRPAMGVIHTIEDTGKTGGLDRGAAPHRRRGGENRRGSRRNGHGSRRATVQPHHEQPGQRRRVLHPPHFRAHRGQARAGRLRRRRLGRSQKHGDSTRPSTSPAAAVLCWRRFCTKCDAAPRTAARPRRR